MSKRCHEFSKLDHLEKLYEKSRLVSESRFSMLQEEYERIKKTTNCSDEEIPTDTTNSNPCSNKITGEFVKVRWDLLKNRVQILESELQDNFNMTLEDLRKSGSNKSKVRTNAVSSPVTVQHKRIQVLHTLKEKQRSNKIDLELDKAHTEKYKISGSKRDIQDISKKTSPTDYSQYKEKREYSVLTLTAEISRYLNIKPSTVKQILDTTVQGTDAIVHTVNEFNELLYDWIIPKLFQELYEIETYEQKEDSNHSLS